MSESQKVTPHYERIKLSQVMQFYANSFVGDDIRKYESGGVMADWWVDSAKGEVVFQVWIVEEPAVEAAKEGR